MTYLLDISRTVSRAGLPQPTGIDRVERAYITEILNRDPNAKFLVGFGKRVAVLDGGAVRQFLWLHDKGAWPRPYLVDMFRTKLRRELRSAYSFCRKNNQLPTVSNVNSGILRDVLPAGFTYVNVGHSNLTNANLERIRAAGAADIRIMIHDLIPLDHPEYTRPDQVDLFQSRLDTALAHADVILANSKFTALRVKAYAEKQVNTIVAHLGIESSEVVQTERAPAIKPVEFLCLGTIEPRKNHAVLLDAWSRLAEKLPPDQVPILHIVGRRGWQNEKVFNRLDTDPLMGRFVIEHGALDDAALVPLYKRATAMVFPSFAEGYGLPVLEALAMQVPVICSDLEVLHEILGEHAVFLDPNVPEEWVRILMKIAIAPQKYHSESQDMGWIKVPTWQNHFELALA